MENSQKSIQHLFYFSSSSSSSGVSKTPTSSFKSRNGIGNPTDSITIPVITGTPADEDLDHQDTADNDKLLDDPSSVSGEEKPSRKGRIERGADARRYHTAGAIEDIKVGATFISSIINEFNYDQGPSINYVYNTYTLVSRINVQAHINVQGIKRTFGYCIKITSYLRFFLKIFQKE